MLKKKIHRDDFIYIYNVYLYILELLIRICKIIDFSWTVSVKNINFN